MILVTWQCGTFIDTNNLGREKLFKKQEEIIKSYAVKNDFDKKVERLSKEKTNAIID